MWHDPYRRAEELGIEVIHRNLKSANGLWLPEHNVIVIREGMRTVWDRCTLAHELGHAELGHTSDAVKHEVLADRHAAGLMVNPCSLKRLMRRAHDVHEIAQELNVTTRLLRVYLQTYPQAM